MFKKPTQTHNITELSGRLQRLGSDVRRQEADAASLAHVVGLPESDDVEPAVADDGADHDFAVWRLLEEVNVPASQKADGEAGEAPLSAEKSPSAGIVGKDLLPALASLDKPAPS